MDWYKHHAKDFLEGTADMTNVEVGIYIRLLDHQFSRGGYLPLDFGRLCELVARTGDDEAALRNVLLSKFREHKRGYCNLRMLRTVREARQLIEKRRFAGSKGGQASAQARAGANVNQRARARRASSSSSSSSSSSHKETLPTELRTEAFAAKWEEWLTYRRTERKPAVTEKGAQRSLAMLAKVGADAAIEAIDDAMRNGYQGLHPKSAPKPKRRSLGPEESDLTPLDYSYLDKT